MGPVPVIAAVGIAMGGKYLHSQCSQSEDSQIISEKNLGGKLLSVDCMILLKQQRFALQSHEIDAFLEQHLSPKVIQKCHKFKLAVTCHEEYGVNSSQNQFDLEYCVISSKRVGEHFDISIEKSRISVNYSTPLRRQTNWRGETNNMLRELTEKEKKTFKVAIEMESDKMKKRIMGQ